MHQKPGKGTSNSVPRCQAMRDIGEFIKYSKPQMQAAYGRVDYFIAGDLNISDGNLPNPLGGTISELNQTLLELQKSSGIEYVSLNRKLRKTNSEQSKTLESYDYFFVPHELVATGAFDIEQQIISLWDRLSSEERKTETVPDHQLIGAKLTLAKLPFD